MRSAKINIPPSALPFKDANIKKLLETKLKLFEKSENELEYKAFHDLRKEVDSIRDKYLVHIKSRKMSVIKIEHLKDFKEKVVMMQGKLEVACNNLDQFIAKNILETHKRLKEELRIFLEENPANEIRHYNPELRTALVQKTVDEILSKVKYPKAEELINKMKLEFNLFDPTWEDFKNKAMLDELAEKGVFNRDDLESIVSIKEAFEVKH